VAIPKSVVEIERGAFQECDGLRSISIPEGVISIDSRAFYKCQNLESAFISNSVRSIDSEAFAYCQNLETVSISDGVEYIGSSCFLNTKWFDNHPDGLLYIGKVAYRYKGTMPVGTVIEIKEGTISISPAAFSGCTGLTEVSIPASVVKIGMNAFSSCKNLSSVTILDGVKSIEGYAFYGCISLQSVVIPYSICSIGEMCFKDCSKLSLVTLHDNLEFIGDDCFDDTPWYNSLPDGLIYLGKVAYSYKGIMPEDTHIVIKDGTTCISGSCFEDRATLTSISIPGSVVNIDNGAFSYCTGLSVIVIPDGVKSIGSDAFYYCTGLKSVYIPSSVNHLGYCCFKSCKTLQNVYVFRTDPLPIAYDDFSYGYGATLHVPFGCEEVYKAVDYWNNFNAIVGDIDLSNVAGIRNERKGINQVFDLKGRFHTTPQRGLNIIRMSDGTVRKTIIK